MYLFGQFFTQVYTLYQKMLLSMPNVLGIDRVKIALRHGEIIDCIQEIGLTGPIIPHETIDFLTEIQLQLVIILEINKGKAG